MRYGITTFDDARGARPFRVGIAHRGLCDFSHLTKIKVDTEGDICLTARPAGAMQQSQPFGIEMRDQ
jgi:hypothetical protein